MRIEFHAPDLVIYHYHPQTHLTWPMLQEVAEVTNKITNYRSCFMCSIIGYGLTIDKEARENGTKPDIQKYTRAAAIIQNSLAHRILANFIIRIQRPPVPTKSFSNLNDALDWFSKLRKAHKSENSLASSEN